MAQVDSRRNDEAQSSMLAGANPTQNSIDAVAAFPKPVLRWAGGKRWLAPILAPLVRNSERYFEPFLGGGAVFLSARPPVAILADSNSQLMLTYRAIRDQPDEVLARLDTWTNTAECYYNVRSATFASPSDRAAQFLYLNRTCWNGLHRVNREGRFNVPYGNNPERVIVDVTNFLLVSDALQTAELLSGDFASTLSQAESGDFVYIDPPYVTTSRPTFNRYNAEVFSWIDQKRLAITVRALVEKGCHVAVSNADTPELRDMYSFLRVHRFQRSSLIAGHAHHRQRVSEALFATEDLSTLLSQRLASPSDA